MKISTSAEEFFELNGTRAKRDGHLYFKDESGFIQRIKSSSSWIGPKPTKTEMKNFMDTYVAGLICTTNNNRH
jgi:hypothetical protein